MFLMLNVIARLLRKLSSALLLQGLQIHAVDKGVTTQLVAGKKISKLVCTVNPFMKYTSDVLLEPFASLFIGCLANVKWPEVCTSSVAIRALLRRKARFL